jgi:hypothetical protein
MGAVGDSEIERKADKGVDDGGVASEGAGERLCLCPMQGRGVVASDMDVSISDS